MQTILGTVVGYIGENDDTHGHFPRGVYCYVPLFHTTHRTLKVPVYFRENSGVGFSCEYPPLNAVVRLTMDEVNENNLWYEGILEPSENNDITALLQRNFGNVSVKYFTTTNCYKVIDREQGYTEEYLENDVSSNLIIHNGSQNSNSESPHDGYFVNKIQTGTQTYSEVVDFDMCNTKRFVDVDGSSEIKFTKNQFSINIGESSFTVNADGTIVLKYGSGTTTFSSDGISTTSNILAAGITGMNKISGPGINISSDSNETSSIGGGISLSNCFEISSLMNAFNEHTHMVACSDIASPAGPNTIISAATGGPVSGMIQVFGVTSTPNEVPEMSVNGNSNSANGVIESINNELNTAIEIEDEAKAIMDELELLSKEESEIDNELEDVGREFTNITKGL